MRSLLIASLSLVLVTGAGCLPSASLPQKPTVPTQTPVTLEVGEHVSFDNGLEATLTGINDSRCQAGVVCIWQGELAPTLEFSGGHLTETTPVTLGTETHESVIFDIYSVELLEATVDTATISVSTNKN